jgi:hypothetical protein
MTSPTLRALRYTGGLQRIFLRDRTALAGLGPARFANLVRCLVWCDRLMALKDVLAPHMQGGHTPARVRNAEAHAWMIAGALYEACRAVETLEAQRLHEHLGADGRKHWDVLIAARKRWATQRYSHLRSKGAFHVDQELVIAGLDSLLGAGGEIAILEMLSDRNEDAWFPVAHRALARGLKLKGDLLCLDDALIDMMYRDTEELFPAAQSVLWSALGHDASTSGESAPGDTGLPPPSPGSSQPPGVPPVT